MIIKTGQPQNVQILVDKPPKFLGVPLKKFILAYHVIFLVLLIKEMHDRVLPPVPLIIMAWITVVSFFLIKSKQKTYIKIHFWISLAFLIAVLLMMMFAVFY
ncbi:hypothetical protein B9Z55_010795 [Caenorhabditis nigoni]|uniref:Uncharacterized protein n=1 Tax=Caenorhabditis nigoni TaxID=1611254 RepID=A0A2G5UHB0_9PELO|nr:hypothetical protein B9Z55_010795 [Caenorhabditis nigoni]